MPPLPIEIRTRIMLIFRRLDRLQVSGHLVFQKQCLQRLNSNFIFALFSLVCFFDSGYVFAELPVLIAKPLDLLQDLQREIIVRS